MTALVLALLMFGPANIDPYKQYLESVAHHQLDSSTASFAKTCSMQIEKATVTYGVKSAGAWKRTSNLATALHSNETDFFSSVEVWRMNGKVRFVRLWDLELDTGSQVDLVACVDGAGSVVAMDATAWNLPLEGDEGGWAFQEMFRRNASAVLVRTSKQFINTRGEVIREPKMDLEEKKGLDWTPSTSVVLSIASKVH